MPVCVYALRRDGFDGDIRLALKDAPDGFALSGGVIPAGRDIIRMTLTAPKKKLEAPVTLQLTGSAVIGGRTVSRPAVAAEDMMQAFD
ncbi:MAG: peptidase, partial [bacterium]|nr:peptidase [bacterium]